MIGPVPGSAMSLIVDTLLSGQLLFAALVTGSLYALVALGLNLVYGTHAHAQRRAWRRRHARRLRRLLGVHAAGVSPLRRRAARRAALGGAAGLALYRGAVPPPAARGAGAAPARLEGNSLLLFFGLSIILQNVAALAFTPNTRGYPYSDEVYRLGNVAMTGNRLAALVVAGATCIAVACVPQPQRRSAWRCAR